MTEESNNTVSCKWSMEEREKILTTGTLEQKKEAFRDDEELMKETTKFVSDVIQTAISEASKRKMEVCYFSFVIFIQDRYCQMQTIHYVNFTFQKGDDSEGNHKKRIIFASRERIDCISSEKHIVKKRYILDRLKIDFISKFIFIHNFFDN